MWQFPGYSIIEQIDATYRSVVFRAHRLGAPGDTVIIKALRTEYQSPSDIARLKHEYSLIRGIDIQGIVKPLDVIEHENGLALVLEDFGAVSLKKIMKGSMGLERFLNLAICLSEILGRLHSSGITHRDIKPSNILLNQEQGILKLTDFGIAAEVSRSNEEIYNPRIMEGTLAYISPEQTGRMNCAVDYRCDLYSLGITFYEMLTGGVPFISQDPMEIIHAHIAKVPIAPHIIKPDIPPVISDIIVKLLAKAPEERYQNSFGLHADLKACLEQLKNTGGITPFTIGTHDISLRFNIPQVMVGRDREISVLLETFERASRGGRELLMVTGEPGIGKSSLVNEIHRPIVAKRGYFMAGKFDQFRRYVPYSAIIQAFQGLVRQILTEDHQQTAVWKQKLLNALGPNGRIITDTIPEIAHIIGEQPDLAELGPEEAQNRFNHVCRNFMRVFATSEHPLVLFLDDLQWADSASMNLIRIITTDRELTHVLFIGSYRDNEVAEHHPLRMIAEQIVKDGTPIAFIKLEELSRDSVQSLIANFLRCGHEAAKSLADVIFEKTRGNPFFVNQFLKTLYEEGHLVLDAAQGWKWDADAIRNMQVTDNVVDLLSVKIDRLAPEIRYLIQVCACIGNRFDIASLSTAMGRPVEDVLTGMDTLIQEGLIHYSDGLYRFHHDRILEAAYALIPVSDRETLHAKIGRQLLATTPPETLSAKIFYIADQLNQARSLITTVAERHALAELNLKAGQKAKESTAYGAAADYLQAAMEFLPEKAWKDQYDLTFAIYRECMECEYLNRNFSEAERLFAIVTANAADTFDKAKIYHTMVVLYTTIGKLHEAIALGLKGLRMFGVHISPKASKLDVLRELVRLKIKLKKIGVENVPDLPLMTDPAQLTIAMLCGGIGTPAYYVNPNLFAVVVLKGINGDLEKGLTHTTAFGFMAIAVILGANLGQYEEAERIAQMALKLNAKLSEKRFACKVNFLYAFMIMHWTKPFRDSLDYYRRAYQYGLETGDFIYCGHCLTALHMARALMGDNLDEVQNDLTRFKDFITGLKDPFSRNQYQEIIHMCLHLKGLTESPASPNTSDYCLEQHLADMRAEGNLLNVFFLLLIQERIFYLCGKYEEAYRVGFEMDTLLEIPAGSMHIPEHIFYRCLSALAVYQEKPALEKKRILFLVKRFSRKLKVWAELSPASYQAKYLLVAAETAVATGRFQEAATLYHRAVQAGREQKYANLEALANERAAVFYHGLGLDEVRRVYLKAAYLAYSRWGAVLKARELLSSAPTLLTQTDRTVPAGDTHTKTESTGSGANTSALDLSTVMQASQAISGEIVLDRLLQKIMKIAVLNAGAQRGCLILDTDGKLTIEVGQEVSDEANQIFQSEPVEISDHLARSVVNYVHHCGETLILADALQDPAFKNDPYILKHHCKSILCTSIMSKGKLAGILYMENNLTANAFTPDRVELLRVILAQAAISLENARLFDLATTDGLTRLFVHRYFQLLLDSEIQKHQQSGQPFSLIMMDIDDFKVINDTYGHQFGDKVLRRLAQGIKRGIRDVDIAARYGGEEFVLILPETGTTQAMNQAENVRAIIAGMQFKNDGQSPISTTISLGVATFPYHATDKESLIKSADQALYTAKRSGKNRVCVGEKTR